MKRAKRPALGPIVLVLVAVAIAFGIWLAPAPVSSADYAAWAQAIGTVAAIGAAAFLGEMQVWRQRRERASIARAVLIKLTWDLPQILERAAARCRAKSFGGPQLTRLDEELEAAMSFGNSLPTAVYFGPSDWAASTMLADRVREFRGTFPELETIIQRHGRLPVYQFDSELERLRRLIQMLEDDGVIRGTDPVPVVRSPSAAGSSGEVIRREAEDAADRLAFVSP